MIERRALVRHKTFIKGRIYFNNRLSTLDCIVRDVTANGGRIEVAGSVTLPDSFEIYLPNKDECFFAHVIWRKGNHLGVSWSHDHASKQKLASVDVEHTLADRVAKLERDVAALQKRLELAQEA